MYKIKTTPNELLLLDWVLTMHSWDQSLLDKLTRDYSKLRESIGLVLTEVFDTVQIESHQIDELMAMIPIMFRIGGEDVGLSLKKKLWRARLNLADPEETHANQDYPQSNTED